jgi:hypothetical protein
LLIKIELAEDSEEYLLTNLSPEPTPTLIFREDYTITLITINSLQSKASPFKAGMDERFISHCVSLV